MRERSLKTELLEELSSVISGRTFDALLPPLVFVLLNGILGLDIAVLGAVMVALFFSLLRIRRKQNWWYAAAGLLGVILASLVAYLTRSAGSYFIPAILSSALLLLLVLLSLLSDKPLAAWTSHLVRGWPLGWFWRKDIKPAYREVTLVWGALIFIRLVIQVLLYRSGDPVIQAWANILLGWPVIIAVLVLSYLYGTWRLRRLGGPGVDEYKEAKKPPWIGQTRGF